ncbi:bifunctional hydroxymethylpyrimidine kinase/phosphomethylpyrimidine kinase [Streptococcus hongkongensis]
MRTNLLAIAGNDILSGGGLQIDILTSHQLGAFPFLAPTCLTTISEEKFNIYPTELTIFKEQLSSLNDVPFSAIKIGLLPTPEIVKATADFIKGKEATKIVLDPVLVFKENQDETVVEMAEQLKAMFSLVDIITPNLKEAELLSGVTITDEKSMIMASNHLLELGANCVVIKGGNRLVSDRALDLYRDKNKWFILEKPIINKNNNGAGCTFATAIATYLSKGIEKEKAVELSKDFVYRAINNSNEYGVSIT